MLHKYNQNASKKPDKNIMKRYQGRGKTRVQHLLLISMNLSVQRNSPCGADGHRVQIKIRPASHLP